MRRGHRSVHPWLWMLTGSASAAVLIVAVMGRTDPTPDQTLPEQSSADANARGLADSEDQVPAEAGLTARPRAGHP